MIETRTRVVSVRKRVKLNLKEHGGDFGVSNVAKEKKQENVPADTLACLIRRKCHWVMDDTELIRKILEPGLL